MDLNFTALNTDIQDTLLKGSIQKLRQCQTFRSQSSRRTILSSKSRQCEVFDQTKSFEPSKISMAPLIQHRNVLKKQQSSATKTPGSKSHRNSNQILLKQLELKKNNEQYLQNQEQLKPDYNLKVIKSKKITLDEHIYPEQSANKDKHQFDIAYHKIVTNRLQNQWRRNIFQQINRIEYKPKPKKPKPKKKPTKIQTILKESTWRPESPPMLKGILRQQSASNSPRQSPLRFRDQRPPFEITINELNISQEIQSPEKIEREKAHKKQQSERKLINFSREILNESIDKKSISKKSRKSLKSRKSRRSKSRKSEIQKPLTKSELKKQKMENIHTRTRILQTNVFNQLDSKLVKAINIEYENEKFRLQRCNYHKNIEKRLQKQMGWNKRRFLQEKVSATEIIEKEVEDYLFKNDAKMKYFEQLKQGMTISQSEQKLKIKTQDWNPWTARKENPITMASDYIEKNYNTETNASLKTRQNSEFKQEWLNLKKVPIEQQETLLICQIEGCDNIIDSEEGDSSDENLSISNATSFDDFYNFNEKERWSEEDPMKGIKEAEKGVIGFRYLPNHKFKKIK